MKNTFKYIAFLLIGAVSCTGLENDLQGGKTGNVKIEVKATIAGQDKATKTAMGELNANNVYPINWSEGDKIGLIESASSIVSVALTDGAGTNSGTFGGNVEDLVAPFTGTALYPAGYPAADAFADAGNLSKGLFVGSYLPVKQTFKDGSFADNVYPMAAVSADGFKYGFYNLGAVIQLKLLAGKEGDAIRAIYLTGNKGEVLAGGIGMYFDSSTLEPVASTLDKDGPYLEGSYDSRFKIDAYGSEEYTRVIVDFHGGELALSTSEVTYVNIAVLPQTFENGFTIEVVDADNFGSTYYEAQDNITLARSCVKSMKTITYSQGEALEVANSYVYEDEGYYIMPAYAMGNRLGVNFELENRNVDAALLWSDVVKDGCPGLVTDTTWLKPAVTNIEYIRFADGYNMLQFRINEDPATQEPYRGNAAIALYDTDTKEIIWSWHVWMTDTVYDKVVGGSCIAGSYVGSYPSGEAYNYDGEAASSNMIIMDRNLGAISANPNDGWKTYGLYYQNGRRDPFIGAHWNGSPTKGTQTSFGDGQGDKMSVRLDESTPFSHSETRCWYNAELAPVWASGTAAGWCYYPNYLTVTEAFQHPMTFSSGYEVGYGSSLRSTTDGVPTYSTESTGNGQWTWYGYKDNKSWLDISQVGSYSEAGSHGNTGMTDGGHQAYWNRTKTIMDPCPVGYSVLGDKAQGGGGAHAPSTKAGEENVTYLGNDSKSIAQNSITGAYGLTSTHTYGGVTYTTWWPAAGVRTITGLLAGVGYQGLYFHYDHIAATHGGHGTSFSAAGFGSTDQQTNHAGSVRCVREKQLSDLSKYPINISPDDLN